VNATRYYLRTGGSPERPLTLLRRISRPGGRVSEQVLRRDLRWYPTELFLMHARTGEFDLAEITADRAAELVGAWRVAR
jgi:hypothetical protein